MTLYQCYTRLPIRFAELGLERGSEKSSYFCTPEGARVIGWAGVGGIHFCFVPGYGDAVFAVNPMAAGEYVQAVARSFADFLRLVLACGGSAAIEQAHGWSREQFEAFVGAENTDYPPRTDALRIMAEKLELTPMPDPYGYLLALGQALDCSALQPREVPAAPVVARTPFPVAWDSSIHGSPRRRKPAREVAVNAAFSWGEEEWRVPSLYVCAEGVMVDYCVGVDVEKVTEFLRWHEELVHGDWGMELSQERQEEAERRNPLHIAFHSSLTVDGVDLPAKSGSSTFWVPEGCGSEELTAENRRTQAIMDHYGLNEEKAWLLWRSSYPWKGRRGTAVKSVSLHLTRDKVSLTAARFTDPAAGDALPIIHPTTGESYTLRITDLERQVLDKSWLRDADTEYPDHFAVLTAIVEPPLEGMAIRDCAPSDPPRRKNGGAMSIAIFGRKRDFPAAPAGQQTLYAASSMHFAPPDSITWRAEVQVKPMEDMEAVLIP